MKNTMKKSVIVTIMGQLVKKTPSRHYWLYNGKKWVRLGLARIAELLKVPTDVIKATIFTASKKALASMAKANKEGSHSSILWVELLVFALFAPIYLLCTYLVGDDAGFLMASLLDGCLATWMYHKITTHFYKGGAVA